MGAAVGYSTGFAEGQDAGDGWSMGFECTKDGPRAGAKTGVQSGPMPNKGPWAGDAKWEKDSKNGGATGFVARMADEGGEKWEGAADDADALVVEAASLCVPAWDSPSELGHLQVTWAAWC